MDDAIQFFVEDNEIDLEKLIVLETESKKVNNTNSNKELDQVASKQNESKTNMRIEEKQGFCSKK